MTTKTMYATRTFKDAGTERHFERGKPIEGATDGELANYVAAGLASDDQPKAEKPADDPAKGSTKPAGKPA